MLEDKRTTTSYLARTMAYMAEKESHAATKAEGGQTMAQDTINSSSRIKALAGSRHWGQNHGVTSQVFTPRDRVLIIKNYY